MATARCLVLLAIACFIAPSSAQDGAALNCSVACNNCTKLCDNCTIYEFCCIECCQEAEACFLPYKRTPITAAAIVGIVILAIAYQAMFMPLSCTSSKRACHICMCVRICIYMYIYVYICIYVYVYMYICMYEEIV
jgi:hypothetical protein